MNPLLKLTNIGMIYNRNKNNEVAALTDLNLDVFSGDFISIMGPSGSGKSTLLHIMGALLRPTSGTYTLRETPVYSCNDKVIARIRNQEIGFVLQDFGLLGERTALENVMVPLYFSKTPLRSVEKKAIRALEKLSIRDLAARKANQLSGGQRQRVAIARAMVMEPALLLADEPTGALDSKTAVDLMDVFEALNNHGVAVIIVTHDIRIAQRTKKTLHITDGIIQQ